MAWLVLTVCVLLRSAGGVKLVGGGNRITIDNTLDERMRLLEDRVCLSLAYCSIGLLISLASWTDAARDPHRPLRHEREPQVQQLSPVDALLVDDVYMTRTLSSA